MTPDFKNVVIINDWHVGSPYSMWPRDFKASNGATIPLNAGQEYLLRCRDHALSTLPDEIDVLVLNGDQADGQNPAEHCKHLMEVDAGYQRRAAVELIKPFSERAKKIYATTGTGYHRGWEGNLDTEIAENVGAIPDKMGRFARPWLLLNVDDMLISIHHHQSGTVRYRSMPMEREVAFALEFCGRTGERMPDVFVAAHVHWGFGLWYEDGNFMAISSPAMKLQDTYAASGKYPWRWRPHKIGFTWLKIYDEPVNGFRVWPDTSLLYPHPSLGTEVAHG